MQGTPECEACGERTGRADETHRVTTNGIIRSSE